MRKSVDNEVYVVKTMKQINEEAVQDIANKKDQAREIRKERRHHK